MENHTQNKTMTTNFDPKTHKFGMAYLYKEHELSDVIFYPTSWDEDGFCVYGYMDGFNNPKTKLFHYNLTRSPEHDLIPRADVMELVSLIDCLIQNNPDESISDAGHTVLQLWKHDAQRALTNFKQKYG